MEQQTWILRSLLTQLEEQEAAGDEDPNNVVGEFVRLKSQSTKYRTDKTYSTKTAEKQENIKKNRYKDIVPFDHTRVKLTLTTSKKDSDYINASFIQGVFGSKAYIATQGPLPPTVVDFLRMLWEYNIQVVVMSCREFEMGKKKCELYWPQKQDEAFVCEPFTVHCDSEKNKGDYLTRTLRLTYRNSSRILKQLHYVNWPDHGVPDTIPPILDMLHEMRVYQAHDDVPICLHCSAGCGRTGALMVIDYTWNLLRKHMIASDFSIYNVVQDMRTQRTSVVQTKEQYELVYRTIKELFQRYLDSMETHNCQREVSVVPPAEATTADSELSGQSELFDSNSEHRFQEKSELLLNHQTHSASASENVIDFRFEDMQWGQQQHQPFPGAHQDLNEGSRSSLLTSQTEDGSVLESRDIPVLNSPPRQTITESDTVRLMVEDPYFDTPMGSPSPEEPPREESKWIHTPTFMTPSLLVNDQTMEPGSPVSVLTDEEVPPPLPERTPESFILAVDTDLCERLSVIFPPNTDTDEGNRTGSPPSPVPPLPERTPESFELASDPIPVVKQKEVPLAVNLSVIGISSEWSGNSTEASAFQNESTFVRSKSVRAHMTFSAEVLDDAVKKTSNLNPLCAPLEPLTPPHPLTKDSLALPVSDRTPEPLTSPKEGSHKKRSMRPLSVGTFPLLKVGMSSEWDGTAQPKTLLDAFMNRSKSVRAKSSKQEALSVSPLPVVAAQGGSAQVEQLDLNRKPSLNADRPGNNADRSSEKGMSRAKSLKLFRNKLRPQFAPPPPPAPPGATPPSGSAAPAVVKLGFGLRFGKPKGPRSYPDTWV